MGPKKNEIRPKEPKLKLKRKVKPAPKLSTSPGRWIQENDDLMSLYGQGQSPKSERSESLREPTASDLKKENVPPNLVKEPPRRIPRLDCLDLLVKSTGDLPPLVPKTSTPITSQPAPKSPSQGLDLPPLVPKTSAPIPRQSAPKSPSQGLDLLVKSTEDLPPLVPKSSALIPRQSAPKSPSPMPRNDKEDMDREHSSGKRKRKEESGPRRKKSSHGSEDIIEVITDDEDEAKEVVSNTRRLRSSSTLPDNYELCIYPSNDDGTKSKDSMTVCVTDYKSLEHDTFLNDIIIDFYLLFLYHERLPKDDQALVHIFSTMFYKRLTSSYKSDESGSNSSEKKHLRVKGWTKHVNLFDKKMLIFPICEHSHWYLVIAIRPSLVSVPVEDREDDGEPLFLVLDSLGGTKSGAVTNIRHYLAQEWRAKMADKHDGDCYDFNHKSMRTLRPKKPEQENFSDCGIYLLHYVEKIFESIAQFFYPRTIEQITKDWFTTEEVSRKRKAIADIIEGLSREKLAQSNQLLPVLQFTPSVAQTRSKSRKPCYKEDLSSDEDLDPQTGIPSLAASGFYGERSGLYGERSGLRSQSHLLDESSPLQRSRDREARAKRRQEEKEVVSPPRIPVRRKARAQRKEEDQGERFDKMFEETKKEKTRTRKVATVPVTSFDEIEKIHQKPRKKSLSAKAIVHLLQEPESKSNDNPSETSSSDPSLDKSTKSKDIDKSGQGSQRFNSSIIPTRRPRVGLETFKAFQDGSKPKEASGEVKDVSSRWDKCPKAKTAESKMKLLDSVHEHLKLIEDIDNDDKLNKPMEDLSIKETPKSVKKINLADYRQRKANPVVDDSAQEATSQAPTPNQDAVSSQSQAPDSLDIMSVSRSPSVVAELEVLDDKENDHKPNDGLREVVTVAIDDEEKVAKPDPQEEDDDVIEEEVAVLTTSKQPDTRPGSPEVLQITKAIPEDSEVKITLTKSPAKAPEIPPAPSIRLVPEEDDCHVVVSRDVEEITATQLSPIFRKKRRDHPRNPSDEVPKSVVALIDSDQEEDIPEESQVTSRPRRNRQFSNLSEIEKAKLKNLPYEEREKCWNREQERKSKEKSKVFRG